MVVGNFDHHVNLRDDLPGYVSRLHDLVRVKYVTGPDRTSAGIKGLRRLWPKAPGGSA